jgi:hypothetical protein
LPVDNSNKTPNSSLDDIRNADKETDLSHIPTNHYLNIEILIPKYPDKFSTLKEIESLISKIYSGREQMFRVGRKNISAHDVRHVLRSLDNRHVEYVINSLRDTRNVKDFKAYLLTSLYNAASKPLPVDVKIVEGTVRNNIQFDFLMMKYTGNQQEHLKALFNIIVEVLITRKNSFRIAKGDFLCRKFILYGVY